MDAGGGVAGQSTALLLNIAPQPSVSAMSPVPEDSDHEHAEKSERQDQAGDAGRSHGAVRSVAGVRGVAVVAIADFLPEGKRERHAWRAGGSMMIVHLRRGF